MPEQMLARFNASSQSHVGPVEVWDDGPDGDLSASAEGALPLCVDLDGTLVKSNTVADSALALVRHNPRALLSFPGWLIQGMEVFRRRLEKSVSLDPASLPYNQPLLEFLFEQHAAGRLLYLSTAGNGVVAQRVADHFRVFAGVLVTDGGRGLRGNDKWKVFRDRLGEKFSYIGNAAADLPALTCCEEPMVANPAGRLRAGLRAGDRVLLARTRGRLEFHRLGPGEHRFLEALRSCADFRSALDGALEIDPSFDGAAALQRFVLIHAIVDF